MTIKPVFATIMLVSLAGTSIAQARVEFSHDFAPAETWVKGDAIEFWLNGKSVLKNPGADRGTPIRAEGRPLQREWNHFLIRVLHDKGDDKFEAKLICSQPEFFHDLKSAVQKT